MPQKHKRSWSVEGSRVQGCIKKRAVAKRRREDYKLERVRALIEEGITKHDLDERRARYYCMKEHPGRFCSQCNPRADEEDSEGLSDEEAEMSDSWSDGPVSDDDQSLTYSEIWGNEEEKDTVVKYIKGKIKAVDTAATRLKTLVDDQQAGKPLIGGLRGKWTLYNLDVCPKRYEPTGEYHRLTVSEAAVKGELVNQDRVRHPPYEIFMEWLIKDAAGDIIPFPFPTHASLEPVPIQLMTRVSDDVPAEIVFLGDDCLWLRVPRSTVYPKEASRLGTSSPMIEFAGVRQTEADIEEIKRRHEKMAQEWERANSPETSIAASLCGWDY
ncbi:hypothetical protein P152DRAFT_69920 [Eremomyces bilateralis CBS 781.70]|uniref:Uncharacterized protein n=1 Tax=Eremomyces bilateralis CBS 781.70 TaxID=1392243 RepID=A0A6G1G0J0_9PEZI|nr:uncharacterized protein P152DRAFT_69920 [Eremomyces bilateralis CBS 781.70]KAF1811329.1 hypothetical protein P152DRAFT_69920 [Eremomyces bilateralis CBS 781.70]